MPGRKPCEPGCGCGKHHAQRSRRATGPAPTRKALYARRSRARARGESVSPLRVKVDPDAETVRVRRKDSNLWRYHGMRLADWEAMWTAQQGRCYLCSDPLSAAKNRVHVDHDHSCCPPRRSCAFCRRGLACNACNAIIGHAQDDPARLRRIADSLDLVLPATLLRLAGKPIQSELELDGAVT